MPLIVLLLLAAEAPWESTFEPTATSSYLDRPNAAVVVVGAGEGAAAVAQAIVRALRNGNKTRLVMTGESVAVEPDSSDSTIVKRASVLPVDLVVVVRVFPGPVQTAVATLYNKAGAAVSAMAGTEGQPLPMKEGQVATTAARESVVAAVNRSTTGDPETDSERIFLRRGTPFYKRKALEGAQFYEIVGEPSLAAQYRGRTTTKALTIAGGSLLLVAGVSYFLAGDRRCAVYDAAAFSCVQRVAPDPLVSSLLMGGVGLATLVFGIAFTSDPASDEKRLELVKRHNEKVDGSERSTREQHAVTQIHAALSPVPGGAFGSLSFSF